MKSNHWFILLFTSSLLVGCGGGDSDSSGSSSQNTAVNNYEFSFNYLPNCQVDDVNKIIYAARNDAPPPPSLPGTLPTPTRTSMVTKECKVKRPNLNGGLTFSLNCQMVNSTNVYINGASDYMDSLKKMLVTGQPYQVTCEP